MIRRAERTDIPELVDLHLRTFGTPPGRPSDLDYATIFFDHPWADPEVGSLVYEREGMIAGHVGLTVRPMWFGSREVRMAVPSRFMIEETDAKAVVSVALLRALSRVPADVIFGDKSNEAFRRFIVRSGGEVVVPPSLHWTRSFLPARELQRRFGRRRDLVGLAGKAARPAAALIDAGLRRYGWNDFSAGAGYVVEDSLDPDRLCQAFNALSERFALRPTLTPETFGWLLAEVQRMGRERTLHGGVVRSPAGGGAGAFLYYLGPEGKAEVLKLATEPAQSEAVFVSFLNHAWGRGAMLATGRADRPLIPVLRAHRCRLSLGSPWAVMIASDPAIRAAVHGADACLSRLEGEWF